MTSTEQNGASTSALDPLAGQIGHLSPEQEAKFVEFKAVCEKDGVYQPEKSRATLNDTTLLRYLRARKFEVGDALKQLKDTEVWRETNKLDELYDAFDVDAFEEARKVYHQWTGRRDISGRPVYVYEISHIKNHMASFEKSSTIVKSASSSSASDPIPGKLRMLCALYENMSELVLPLCNAIKDRPNPEIPVSTTCHIVDISNVGLMQFWNLKGHMQAASALATAHYPETLERLFILGAPSFFPTVWGWIKRWFDPVTTSKIFILSAGEVQPTLTRFMRPADLPKKYGGELEWEYGMSPSPDGEIVRAVKGLVADKWVRGPLRWVSESGGGGKFVARGTVKGKERNEVVGVLSADGI
ncbi:CRAL-TRIO domain-containing protein [Mycena alexandri]|uniref:CRAL-TRIO domain-containing protein n=1 Tax=Mycena alexandri TaxID=1745969 RepID=A0AAD6WVE6_9AGAR|nr:CRAL-TRIO domain-containing protein [Mycena alexandri]